ncbi:MAG: ATP-binding protein [Chlamydiae bacterium]|nr:ATP-binding protein [Chlamydiota bacterium]
MKRLYSQLIARHFERNRQILFLMGPRQVGKTTLGMASSELGSDFFYLNWDNLDDRALIIEGPAKVAAKLRLSHPKKNPPLVVFDEIHKYRDWKIWIKGFFDSYASSGEVRIIVTGSARLEMFNCSGESLMGRYFRFRIHPLSVAELLHSDPVSNLIRPPKELDERRFDRLLEMGGFPEPFLKDDPQFTEQWKYLREQQLFQDDMRELTRIHEVKQMELLAFQIKRQVGMLSNYASFAVKIRVSNDTIRRWISVLNGLYFSYQIKPYSKNIARSLLKEPKHYLWDWSLATNEGARAENFVASHLMKSIHFWTDCGLGAFNLYFLRDKEKREVDFLVTQNDEPWFLVEVKLSDSNSPAKALGYFQDQCGAKHAFQVVVNAPYEEIDCFSYKNPVIVPAKTFLSQLI